MSAAVLHAGAVVGEERHAERRQLAERGQRLAGPPDGDGTGHRHLGRAPRPRASTSAGHPGRVDGRLRVGHGHDGGVAAEGGGPGPGLDRLGLLAAGLAQMGVQVDQPGRRPGSRRRRGRCTPPGARSTRPPRRRVSPATATSSAGQSVGTDDACRRGRRGWAQATAGTSTLRPPRRRAGGTGWPCAPRRRWPPAGSPPCAAGPPRRRRSRPRGPWARDG